MLHCFPYTQVITSYESKTTYVPFYRVYTPYTIRSASTIYETYSISRTALTFSSGSTSYGRLFKVPLVPEGVFHANYADITVKITVGLDRAARTSHDSDPKFILSDGYDSHYGMGFELRDENGPHCQGIQGRIGSSLDNRRTFAGKTSSSSILPEEFTMIINPYERWGTCYHASDTGVISLASYTCSYLTLTKGLYLEVYRESTSEHYVFNYIIVEIHQN